jgi:hypothetical protein
VFAYIENRCSVLSKEKSSRTLPRNISGNVRNIGHGFTIFYSFVDRCRFTEFGAVFTTVLPVLFKYCYKSGNYSIGEGNTLYDQRKIFVRGFSHFSL